MGVTCLAVVTGIQELAADHHPGDRRVAGQPPARLRFQRPGPAHLPTQPTRVPGQALEVDDDAQLGPDPAGDGELAGFEFPAGQLLEGISGSLATGAGVVVVGGAGQRVQGGHQGLAGLRGELAVDGDHPVHGEGQPHPAAVIAALGGLVGPVGVDGVLEMLNCLAEPVRVQVAGSVQQDRFGVKHRVVGQVLGPGGEHAGVGGGDLTGTQRRPALGQGAAVQGPGGADRGGRRPTGHAQPGSEPAGGGAELDALVGAGGFTSLANTVAPTTTINQPYLASYNLNTG